MSKKLSIYFSVLKASSHTNIFCFYNGFSPPDRYPTRQRAAPSGPLSCKAVEEGGAIINARPRRREAGPIINARPGRRWGDHQRHAPQAGIASSTQGLGGGGPIINARLQNAHWQDGRREGGRGGGGDTLPPLSRQEG